MKFRDLSLSERLEKLELQTSRPLPDAKTAIGFALGRFHESWSEYRSITPTLYLIKEASMGMYITLGKFRRTYGLNQELLEAVLEALEHQYDLQGYLLACEAVSQDDSPKLLFGLQGNYLGENQYGALDLVSFAPYETSFVSEFDVSISEWADLKLQALSANALLSR